MKIKPFHSGIVAVICLFALSCETDDVEPTVTVSLDASTLLVSEASGSMTITATINSATDNAVTVQLSAAGTATLDVDYSLSNSSIVISAGNTSASVQLTALQDTVKEGNESVDLTATAVGATLKGAQLESITIEDDDVAATAQFIINEVLYDPSNSGLDGDANKDGTYEQDGDSFIEFYNPSSQDFDMAGYEIWDDTTSGSIQYTFPSNSVIPGRGVLVVFGTAPQAGTTFGNAVVLASGSGLNFNNSGEVIGVKDPNGKFILSFDSDALSNNPNESYTRNPDITGAFEQHNTNTSVLFSPGTKIDGTSF